MHATRTVVKRSARAVMTALSPLERSFNQAASAFVPSLYRMPDFLCVGFKKSGTTWLSANLRHHPDIFIPPEKELHYFTARQFLPLLTYTRSFPKSRHVVCGDMTPDYCQVSRTTVRYIHKIAPKTRIISMVRNPTDRVWSLTRMHWRMKHPGRDIKQEDPSAIIELWKSRNMQNAGDYLTPLRSWISEFGRNRIHFVIHDHIVSQPGQVLNDLFHYLNVCDFKPDNNSLKQIVFHGQDARLPEELKVWLDTHYRQFNTELNDYLDGAVSNWLDC